MNYIHKRKTPALLNQARTLYRRGESHSEIGRAIGITPDTVRRWLDPEYDQYRTGIAHILDPGDDDGGPDIPTLPFVPGIVITGRYRMMEAR